MEEEEKAEMDLVEVAKLKRLLGSEEVYYVREKICKMVRNLEVGENISEIVEALEYLEKLMSATDKLEKVLERRNLHEIESITSELKMLPGSE